MRPVATPVRPAGAAAAAAAGRAATSAPIRARPPPCRPGSRRGSRGTAPAGVPGADEDGGADQGRARAGARGDPGELAGADQHGDDVAADDDRHHARREPEAVAVHVGIGAGERRQRPLGAEDADAEQARGELHRPHRRAAQHPEVDQRVGAAQLVAHERDHQQQPEGGDQPRPRLAGAVDPDERQAAGDHQQDDAQQRRAGGVDGARLAVLALRDAQRDHGAHADDEEAGDQEHQPELTGEGAADLPAAEGADDRAELESGDDEPVARRVWAAGSARPVTGCRSAPPAAAARPRRRPGPPRRSGTPGRTARTPGRRWPPR